MANLIAMSKYYKTDDGRYIISTEKANLARLI